MKKEDLRKIYYTKWEAPGTDIRGYFHTFGTGFNEDTESVASIAIVENANTGSVEVVLPESIRFVDDWD